MSVVEQVARVIVALVVAAVAVAVLAMVVSWTLGY
jgi:hypothetical protein